MRKMVVVLLVSTLFLLGCSKESSSSSAILHSKELISRSFEDLTLGASEAEFRNKLSFYNLGEMGGLTTYIVYARSYVLPNEEMAKNMKQLDNIEKVICYFFNGTLSHFSIYYFCNYKFNPTWEDFTYNAKQSYGVGKENSINHAVEWNDGRTTLTIEEKYEASTIVIGIMDHYYVATYLDNEISKQKSTRDRNSSPKF